MHQIPQYRRQVQFSPPSTIHPPFEPASYHRQNQPISDQMNLNQQPITPCPNANDINQVNQPVMPPVLSEPVGPFIVQSSNIQDNQTTTEVPEINSDHVIGSDQQQQQPPTVTLQQDTQSVPTANVGYPQQVQPVGPYENARRFG